MDSNALILELLKRPIAYHPIVAKAFGSVKLAVMWSQLYYWSGRTDDPEGWIYKSQGDMLEETGLTRREQETARALAKALEVVDEEVRGTPPTLHYRVNMEKSIELIRAHLTKKTTPRLFSSAIEGKTETPGEFARRFFDPGEMTSKEAIREWLLEREMWNEPVRLELKKFIRFWSEPTKNGKRQLWETKPTFEVKRRIITWLEKAGEWNKVGARARGGMVV